MTSTDTRQHVHSLIDQLSATQLAAIESLLSVVLDPAAHSLRNAPIEDEEIGEEEEQAVARSKEWFEHNEGVPFPDVVAELGFSMDQIRNYRESA
jgi:hypothetical protein